MAFLHRPTCGERHGCVIKMGVSAVRAVDSDALLKRDARVIWTTPICWASRHSWCDLLVQWNATATSVVVPKRVGPCIMAVSVFELRTQ